MSSLNKYKKAFAAEILPIISEIDFTPEKREDYTYILHNNGYTYSIRKLYWVDMTEIRLRRVNKIQKEPFEDERVEEQIVEDCWVYLRNKNTKVEPKDFVVDKYSIQCYTRYIRMPNFCIYCDMKSMIKNGIKKHNKTNKHNTNVGKYNKNITDTLRCKTQLNDDVINNIIGFL